MVFKVQSIALYSTLNWIKLQKLTYSLTFNVSAKRAHKIFVSAKRALLFFESASESAAHVAKNERFHERRS